MLLPAVNLRADVFHQLVPVSVQVLQHIADLLRLVPDAALVMVDQPVAQLDRIVFIVPFRIKGKVVKNWRW